MERERLEVDVIIVGAGPAGLCAAIKLKQLCQKNGQDFSVVVLEKGASIGAHILSGAVIEPRALEELFPDWKQRSIPAIQAVTKDEFMWLSQTKAWRLPTPPQMHNKGNYIVSLGQICRWLGNEAEQLGVEIYTGFPAASVIYDNKQRVIGVTTGDFGVDSQGKPGPNYQPGMELVARYTLFAEGARGSLSQELIERYNLRDGKQPQTYAIGLKELWEIPVDQHNPGMVLHTVGWPLDLSTYGGSFVYHAANQQISLGMVIGLDYKNPYLSPFQELQRFKTHPQIATLLAGGRCISYGARALNEGGLQSIPKLVFPGGALIGCSAGFVNVPKIKGSHNAMKSGMLAADAVFTALCAKSTTDLDTYPEKLKSSWIWDELYHVRNIRPAFRAGLVCGMAYAAIDTYILRGCAPWTFKHHEDHNSLNLAKNSQEIHYPKADNKLTFERLTALSFSNVHHNEDQACHLQLKDPKLAIEYNARYFASPETRYCPAGVYEIVSSNTGENRLQINSQNCLHCKTCDIKDPKQNIRWVPPEGGGGPNYENM